MVGESPSAARASGLRPSADPASFLPFFLPLYCEQQETRNRSQHRYAHLLCPDPVSNFYPDCLPHRRASTTTLTRPPARGPRLIKVCPRRFFASASHHRLGPRVLETPRARGLLSSRAESFIASSSRQLTAVAHRPKQEPTSLEQFGY